MIDAALLILFFVMAYRIAAAIYRESPIFQEFGQPRTLAILVMLFPVGPFVLFVGKFFLPAFLVLAGGAACYVPALLSARSMGAALGKSGTDRTRPARDIASQAFGTAIVGLLYVALNLLYTISVAFIN